MNWRKKVHGVGKLIFYECPRTVLTLDTITILEAVFLFINTKHLPFEGSLYMQPHWFIKGLTIYYEEKEKYEVLKKPKPEV